MKEREEVKTKAKKPRGGRPKGSRNKKTTVSAAVSPPRCPTCGSTEVRVRAGFPPVVSPYNQVHPHFGFAKTVTRRPKACGDCGQLYIEREYA